MTSGKVDKSDDSDKIFLLINEAQKLVVQIRPASGINNSIDITAINNDEPDRPDPLRVPEVIIILCVLLLWCGSIFIFIRHSDILRIRHRDLPFRSSMKPPMNLNHITVVHRTSDMVIHSKPRLSSIHSSTTNNHNLKKDKYQNSELIASNNRYMNHQQQPKYSFDSIHSIPKTLNYDEHFLDPHMISSDVRRSLLDLHRKSMENLSTMRYTMSYSTNDVSVRQQNGDDDQRCVQESPV